VRLLWGVVKRAGSVHFCFAFLNAFLEKLERKPVGLLDLGLVAVQPTVQPFFVPCIVQVRDIDAASSGVEMHH